MSQKQIIVTGASAGIGTEIALAMAQEGYSVVMACRNLPKAQQVRDRIANETGNEEVEVLPLDLASFRSILDFSETLKSRNYRCDVLINNAGTMSKAYETTADGLESTVGVNYAGSYLLTRLLLPLMNAGGRIVNTTSITHKIGRVDEGFLTPNPESYQRFSAYPDSKLAVLLFTIELNKQLSGHDISAYAADPGIVNTDMITMHRWFDPLADLFFRPFIKSAKKGAATAIHLATTDSAQLQGTLYANCRPRKIAQSIIDHPYREKLWLDTEKVILNRCNAIDSEKLHDYLCFK